MIVYGVALLSASMLVGLSIGELLGAAIGVKANVGGVGIAMLLLILLSERYRDKLNPTTESGKGVMFWSSMYIPVVVAMAAQQNVLGAVSGGTAAILAGAGSVILSFLMVILISKMTRARRDADD